MVMAAFFVAVATVVGWMRKRKKIWLCTKHDGENE